MIEPPTPVDEARRLAALRELEVLDTTVEERFDRITRMAKTLFGAEIAVVSLVDEDRQWFKSCQGLEVSETPRAVSFCAHAILADDPLIVPDARLDARFANNPLVLGPPFIRFYVGQPIQAADGSRLGTLCVIGDEARAEVTPSEIEALQDLAGWIESELSVKRLSDAQVKLVSALGAARRKSLTDSLTRMWNRDGTLQVLEAELDSARVTEQPVSVLLVDLDHFKSVNDAHGHLVGDRVLQESTRRMRAALRPSDALGRYGGEEFLCVIAGVDSAACRSAAERVRRSINSRSYRLDNESQTLELGITTSVGFATASGATLDSSALIKVADDALYRAKANGRNRVELAAAA